MEMASFVLDNGKMDTCMSIYVYTYSYIYIYINIIILYIYMCMHIYIYIGISDLIVQYEHVYSI